MQEGDFGWFERGTFVPGVSSGAPVLVWSKTTRTPTRAELAAMPPETLVSALVGLAAAFERHGWRYEDGPAAGTAQVLRAIAARFAAASDALAWDDQWSADCVHDEGEVFEGRFRDPEYLTWV